MTHHTISNSDDVIDIRDVVERLLSELHYVCSTGQIADSEKNTADLRDEAAQHLGFTDFATFVALDGELPATPQERAENLGCYIGHDIGGWYLADFSERERDEEGPSVGFDGRPHYATELEAGEALEAQGADVLKAD